MKRYAILLFLLAFTLRLAAQDADSLYDESKDYFLYDESDESITESLSYPSVDPRQVWQKNGYDSERVEVQRFDPEKWKEVVGETNYAETEIKPREEKPKQHDDDSSDAGGSLSLNLPIPPLALKIIFFGSVFGIIGYLLFLIFKNTSLKARAKVQKPESGDPIEEVTDIQNLEVDSLLQKALASGDYPLAIRICFLGLLKKLDEDGFIIWKKDKTNRDYLTELFRKDRYFDEVKRLTLAYEEVWYGDHNFSTPAYEQIISSFKAIDQKLNASKNGEER